MVSVVSDDEAEAAVYNASGPVPADSRPFLRWAGGKQKLVERLLAHTPTAFNGYFEPFLGAGSLFFALSAGACNLSDANAGLIETYRAIMDRPDLVARYLQQHGSCHSEQEFYRVRSSPRTSRFASAARFIYLNRAAYGGLYRVNRKGEFNVPFGPGRTGLNLPSASTLNRVSENLRKRVVRLEARDFARPCSRAKSGDFVYLDPPYASASPTEFFRHYTPGGFDATDEQRFKLLIDDLTDRGVQVMATVRQTEVATDLFSEYQQAVLDSAQWMSASARGRRLPTLLVKNY